MPKVEFLLLFLVACHRGGTPAEETGPFEDTSPPEAYDDDLGLTCAPASVALPTPPTPVPSFPFLPTSNGWVAATYAVAAEDVPVTFADGTSGSTDQAHAFVSFTDHVVQRPNETDWTRDRLWDLYLGVLVDNQGTWLNTVAETEIGYVPGTGVVRFVQHTGDLEIETWAFAPFHGGAERDLVVVARVTNTGSVGHLVSLVSLENAHTGGEGQAGDEQVSAAGDAVLETRGDDALLHTPLGAPTSRAAAPAGDARNPWQRLTNGQGYSGELVGGHDVAVGFEWYFETLEPGESETRGFVLSIGDDDDLTGRVESFVAGRDAEAVLADEIADWDAWHAVEEPPAAMSDDERAVWLQSTAVLRMAQVREPGGGYGQILASLPPGGWNIAWPRDGAFAVAGLIASGHQDEARDALQFVLDAEAGEYADWLGLDDYLVSVCRYRGDGVEESDGAWCPDGSDAGPNIELDDFGLFLWSFGEYAERWPDDPWIDEALPVVRAGAADPLVQLIDPNSDLLVADSSIWERHWYACFPNGRKQFTWSSIQAVAGLRAIGELTGDATYTEAADRIRGGLLRFAADGGPMATWTTDDGQSCAFLASAPEEICEGCGPYDGSAIDLVVQGLVRPESVAARGTLAALQEALLMDNGSPGFLRNDDGTGSTNPYPWYDDQEWVFIDTRMLLAYHRVGEATGDAVLLGNADTLAAWLVAQARANYDLLPELLSDGVYTYEDDYDRTRPGVDLGGEWQGAVPMVGFGAGSYVLVMEELRAQ